MAEQDTPTPPILSGVPAFTVVDDDPTPGPGQRVVTSPTGTRSVVEETAVASLKAQGYKEGKAAPPTAPEPAVVEESKAPAHSASKQVWVEYAIDQGVPSFEAANMTKDKLIEKVGG